jgi:predicted branched-subunit amino acid permease
MAMYSAALAAPLGAAPLGQRLLIAYLNFDQSFAIATAEYEAAPAMTLAQRVGYFLGVAVPTGAVWWGFTLIGAVLGTAIPDSYPIDFALPIAFIAILAPGLKSLAHVAAALTSVVMALALAWLPSGLGLIVAAMAVGAEVERRMDATGKRGGA